MQNYYEVLNLPLSASLDEIKKSYRHLAKCYHPDLCGDKNLHSRFKDIALAYQTLMDRKSRVLYNEKLLRIQFVTRAEREEKKKKKARVIYSRSLGVLARRGFFLSGLPKALRESADIKYDVEVFLDPEEAKEEGLFEIAVPTKFPCPDCAGRDHYCRFCDGKGYILRPTKVRVLLPKVPVSGEIFEVNLSGLKQGNLSVIRASRLRIRVMLDSRNKALALPGGR